MSLFLTRSANPVESRSLQKGIEKGLYRKANRLNAYTNQDGMLVLVSPGKEAKTRPQAKFWNTMFHANEPLYIWSTILFSSLTVFCWSHGSCPGQHKGKVICDSSCLIVRVLPFSLGGLWSHQADLTWLKIVINSFFPLSLLFFFPLLFFFCCFHLI